MAGVLPLNRPDLSTPNPRRGKRRRTGSARAPHTGPQAGEGRDPRGRRSLPAKIEPPRSPPSGPAVAPDGTYPGTSTDPGHDRLLEVCMPHGRLRRSREHKGGHEGNQRPMWRMNPEGSRDGEKARRPREIQAGRPQTQGWRQAYADELRKGTSAVDRRSHRRRPTIPGAHGRQDRPPLWKRFMVRGSGRDRDE